jgi:UDP-glucose 4-epimerase
MVISADSGSQARGAVLVTGGCGYIGSHVVAQLVEAGERVVVLDNLSTGFADALLGGTLVVGDCGDGALVARLLREHVVDTVMHFAARLIVPESVADPLGYYGANSCTSRSLIAVCIDSGVRRLVFSSTAAVYGIPPEGKASEETRTEPINPYGASKLVTEWMLRDSAHAHDLRYVALRYFNVAGADVQGRIGQRTLAATHLIKVACEVAVGKRERIGIFGTDYPTPDGSGIRDYIHVDDLARAHLLALDYLRRGGESTILNCGYGRGSSVREVIAAVARANGAPIAFVEEPRRAGDPATLVAVADRIRRVLGWSPRHADLDFIVQTALDWERRLATPADRSPQP